MYILWLPLYVFMEFLSEQMSGSLILLPSLGLFFFCCFVLFKFHVIILFYLIILYVVRFYNYFLEACYFLTRERDWIWMGGEVERNWEEYREGKL